MLTEPQIRAETLSKLQETAVLHAAGHSEAALQLVCGAIDDGEIARRASIMKMELLWVLRRRPEFELAGAAHRRQFGSGEPAWGPVSPISAPGSFALSGVVGPESPEITRLGAFAASRRTFALDLGRVERIDFGYTYEFATFFSRWASSGKKVILANVAELNATLLETLGVTRYAALIRRRMAEAPLLAAA